MKLYVYRFTITVFIAFLISAVIVDNTYTSAETTEIRVSGLITDKSGESIDSALIQFIDNSGNSWSAVTDISGMYSIELSPVPVLVGNQSAPDGFSLLQNYPNPFNPSTTIEYELKSGTNIRLDVFNISGQRIRTLFNGYNREGIHTIRWNGSDDRGKSVAAGVYFYRLMADDIVQTKKMLMLDGGASFPVSSSGNLGTSKVVTAAKTADVTYRIVISKDGFETYRERDLLITETSGDTQKDFILLQRRVFLQNERLGRGMNLGNISEATSPGNWSITMTEEYFDAIAEAGFQAVRIPIFWAAYASAEPPYTIDPSFFERADWLIEQANSRGILAVIDMHSYDANLHDNAEELKERFLALWEQIADHYKDYSDDVLFEVLNEPDLTSDMWNVYLAEALEIIRVTNPERTVIIGTYSWSGIIYLDRLVLPESDTNIIVTVHYYEPFHFTHQGAEWTDGADNWLGTEWHGTYIDKLQISNLFKTAARWSEKNERPIWLGEFGAYREADMDSRVRWTSFVARTAEEFGISWAYWEFGAGFGAYDRTSKAWREPLLNALMPTEE